MSYDNFYMSKIDRKISSSRKQGKASQNRLKGFFLKMGRLKFRGVKFENIGANGTPFFGYSGAVFNEEV